MVKVKRDQMTGAILMIAGLIVGIMANRFRIPFTFAYPGPKMLPMIGAFGFVVCGLGIFVEGTIGKKEEKPFMIKEGWVRMGICTLVMCAYVFISSLVGYLVTTPFVAYALVTLFAKGSRSTVKGRVIFSVVFAVVIYAIYVYVFGLSLPEGALF